MGYGFDVAGLSLSGLPQSEATSQHQSAQRLDPWTMIQLPEMLHSPGTFQHTQFMERLCHISLAGPIRELIHRRQPCSVDAVQQHEHDWRQAWAAAGYLWVDQQERMQFLAREIQRGEVFLGQTLLNEFMSPLVRRLLDQGQMTAEEVRAVWDETEAANQRRLSRPAGRRPCVADVDDYESLFFEIDDDAQS